jgi:putative Mg2+ transporter-C (MgtC) family protein
MLVLAFIDTLDINIKTWAASLGWPGEGVLRLILAAIAGGLVGLERELRGRQAGFRTNMLVCIGSALVMLVSIRFAEFPWHAQPGVNINVDPARIAYGVMSGVGFLGAGAIIHSQGSIRGLTTAAGLWCVAAIGLAIGFGSYSLSAVATLMVVCALWFMEHFETMLPKQKHREITLRAAYSPDCVAQAIQLLEKCGFVVKEAGHQRSHDLRYADIRLLIMFHNSKFADGLESRIAGDGRFDIVSSREV